MSYTAGSNHSATTSSSSALLEDLYAIAQRLHRGLLEHHVALLCVMLGCGKLVDQAGREDVEQLNVGIADEEAAGIADGYGNLHRRLDGRAGGDDDLADPGHRLLHGKPAGGRPLAVVAVDQHVIASPLK